MRYHPNPEEGYEISYRLDDPHVMTVEIYDLNGQLIWSGLNQGGISYPISGSRRLGLSSNPVRFLEDGVTKWRNCSDYGVSSGRLIFNQGVQRWDYTGTDKVGTIRKGNIITPDYQISGPFLGHWWMPVGIPWNERNRLATELLLKVADRKVNYGESLGEVRSTASHLAKSASKAIKALLLARRGKWNQALKELGGFSKRKPKKLTFAEGWLEYSYGWVPLFNDIYDSCELLKEGLRKEKLIFSSVRLLRDHHSYSITDGDGHPQFERIWGSSQAFYKAKAYYSIKEQGLASSLDQMGLINPLEVAWALTPYSFVVDWFLPVGNVLQAMTAGVGVEFIDGYFSMGASAQYTGVPRAPLVSGQTLVQNTVESRTEARGYIREKMGSLPYPALYMKSPFSTKHVLSALALVQQLKR